MIKIRKRDERLEEPSYTKISEAIIKSTNGADYDQYKLTLLGNECLDNILEKYKGVEEINVETIHDEVISFLKEKGYTQLALNYSEYREMRNRQRMRNTTLMKGIRAIAVETDRDNANVGNNFSSKLLRMASETNKCSILGTMPKEISRSHEIGDLYYHDLDSFNLTTNCLHIPLRKLLQHGFNTGYGDINPPKRISSGAALACIILQSSQNQWFL